MESPEKNNLSEKANDLKLSDFSKYLYYPALRVIM